MHPRRGCFRIHSGVRDWRASKHRKERMTTRTKKIGDGTCPPGLKSHCAGLLLRKEKGKCDAVKHGAEFPSIGNHSPEQNVTRSGLIVM